MDERTPPKNDVAAFEEEANEPARGIVAEFWDFVRHNKKWWLTPILVAMLLLGLLVILTQTGAGPLLYTIF